MSWYRVYEIDVLRVGQLFLQQNIDSIYPSAGTVLYTDGSGGTFWSTGGSGGGGVDPGPSSGLTQLQLISTVDGLGQIYTSTSAAGVTGDQLYSTVRNLGTAGYISSAQLTSTVRNLGTAGYISSTQLRSTVAGLGAAGYISSSQLTSTVRGLSGSAGGEGVSSLFGVVSSGLSTVALFTSNTSNFYAPTLSNNYSTNLQSTVIGLGTAGYISSFASAGPGVSSLFGVVSSGLSTVAQFTSNTSNYFLPALSNNYSTNLESTVIGLGTAGYISTSQLFSTVAGIGTGGGGGGITPNQLISTTEGLGTAGYISTSQLFSTVAGIGTGGGGGITPNQLISTTEGLGTAGYISTSQLFSTVAGIGTGGGGGITPNQLISTTEGLGTAGYISTSQLLSTSAGITSNISSMIDPAELTSTVIGLGSAGFLSSVGFTDKLTSTVAGLGTAGYLSSFTSAGPGVSSLFGVVSSGLSTIALFTSNTSNYYTPLLSNNYSTNLQSTVTGLGTAGYISAPQLVSTVTGQSILLISTVEGLGLISYISSSQLTSTVTGQQFLLISTTLGLGTAGYISSSQLFSTVAGIGTGSGVTSQELQSTGIGLATLGYISSSQLFSTVAGIGTGGGGGGITTAQLTSTAVGLATFGYISSSQLFSTVAGIGTGGGGGGITTNQLQSTTAGLGTASYASTSTLYNPIIGTQVRFPPINVPSILIQDWSTPVSTVALFTSNTSNYYKNALVNFSTPLFSTVAGLGTASYASTTLIYLPNISTKATLPFPVLGVNPLSTVSSSYGTFSTLTATNTYLGALSTQNAIYFYGLEGTFDRTVLSEQLISTGTQEFLIFKGSSTAENIRLQASGSLIFETGAAPSVFSSAATQSTPTLILTPFRTVGINCNAPAYTLDISGSANITGTASVGGATTVTGVLTSRVRVVAPTITTDQTLIVTDTSTYFFYTTFSPSLSINVPSPAAAGSGWTVTIQNAPASDQVIFVQTTPVQSLSSGDTVRIFTDGISWYFI